MLKAFSYVFLVMVIFSCVVGREDWGMVDMVVWALFFVGAEIVNELKRGRDE